MRSIESITPKCHLTHILGSVSIRPLARLTSKYVGCCPSGGPPHLQLCFQSIESINRINQSITILTPAIYAESAIFVYVFGDMPSNFRRSPKQAPTEPLPVCSFRRFLKQLSELPSASAYVSFKMHENALSPMLCPS